jgi:hypothetical protein
MEELIALFIKYGIPYIGTETPEALAELKVLALNKAKTWLPLAEYQLATLQSEEALAKYGKGKLKEEIGVIAYEVIVACLKEEITILEAPTQSAQDTSSESHTA